MGIAFSVAVSYLVVKKRNRLTPLLDYLTALPLALSGTVIGIGLVMSFNTGWLPLTGTGAIIVLAYVVRRLPYALRSCVAALQQVHVSLEEAAEALSIRRNTARAHLRSIFSKTGVRRQTELVRIFLNSVVLLGAKD